MDRDAEVVVIDSGTVFTTRRVASDLPSHGILPRAARDPGISPRTYCLRTIPTLLSHGVGHFPTYVHTYINNI